MKALLTLTITLFLSSNIAQANSGQCLVNIDVKAWQTLEDALYVAAGGYVFTPPEKADYKVVIDEVAGEPQRCLYGCVEKQEILLIMSVIRRDGQIVYTKNKEAVEYSLNGRQFLERESTVKKARLQLIRSLPECKYLKFKV